MVAGEELRSSSGRTPSSRTETPVQVRPEAVMQTQAPEFLTIKELCTRLRRGPDSIYRAVRRGAIRPLTGDDGKALKPLLFPHDVIDRLSGKNHRRPPQPEPELKWRKRRTTDVSAGDQSQT